MYVLVCGTALVRHAGHVRRANVVTVQQKAGIQAQQARGLGICVDHRRHNRSQEGFNLNVQRLKEYKAKLIVFPRGSRKNVKKGDSSEAEQQAAVQPRASRAQVPWSS